MIERDEIALDRTGQSGIQHCKEEVRRERLSKVGFRKFSRRHHGLYGAIVGESRSVCVILLGSFERTHDRVSTSGDCCNTGDQWYSRF